MAIVHLFSFILTFLILAGILYYIILSYYYQTTSMNNLITETRHGTFYGALNENLEPKDNNNLTFLFYVIRIYASVFLLFIFKGTLMGQVISFFIFSLLYYLWIIIKRPYDSCFVNLKVLLIETLIIIIHLDFICIGIFANNYSLRIYFELIAFFLMLSCIFVDLSFCIILTIKSFIEIISKKVSNHDKNKSKSRSFPNPHNSTTLMNKGKGHPKKCLEENKNDKLNNNDNKISLNEIQKIDRDKQEFEKDKSYNPLNSLYISNKNKNKNNLIIDKNKNEFITYSHSEYQLNQLNYIKFPFKIPPFQLDDSLSFRKSEEKDSYVCQNDLINNCSKKKEEIKKMILEEYKVVIETRKNEFSRESFGNTPAVNNIRAFNKRIENLTIPYFSKKYPNNSEIEKYKTYIMDKLIENPINSSNDNISKSDFDKQLSPLKEFKTAFVNLRTDKGKNNPIELSLPTFGSQINQTSSEKKGIAQIMKTNFFESPIFNSN